MARPLLSLRLRTILVSLEETVNSFGVDLPRPAQSRHFRPDKIPAPQQRVDGVRMHVEYFGGSTHAQEFLHALVHHAPPPG